MFLNGKEFREKHAGKKFYKLTTFDENHNGYIYETGVNIDPNEFKCSDITNLYDGTKDEFYSDLGGFYFVDQNHIADWLRYIVNSRLKRMYWIREVLFKDDSKICELKDRYRTDCFILLKRKCLFDSYDWCKVAVKKDGMFLQYITNQTFDLCKMAIKDNAKSVMYVLQNKFSVNELKELYELAIDKDSYIFEYINHEYSKYQDLCEYAVNKNGIILQFIKTEYVTDIIKIYKLAVNNDGLALQYVKQNNVTVEEMTELCKLAVQQNGLALDFVKDYQTEKICELAVSKNGFALKYVKDEFKTNEIYELAVQQDGYALYYVDKQTEKICELAVRQHGFAIQYVKPEFITMDLYKLTVNKNGYSIMFMNDMINKNIEDYYELCRLAVQQNGCSLQYIKKEFQTEEICRLAVLETKSALKYVDQKFKTKEFCELIL